MEPTGWHRLDREDVPADGRVTSTVVDGRAVAITRCAP